jgi:hypothetical protein
MKTLLISAVLILINMGCKEENIKPPMKVEAIIGEPFIVSAPAEVRFRETDIVIYFNSFTNYIYPGFNPPIVSAKGRIKKENFIVKYTMYCESLDCYYQDFNLDDKYTLAFEEVTASTILEDREGTDVYRVDSARFVLKVIQ